MGNKKKNFTLAFAKKFLNRKGLELFNKSNQIKSDNNNFRSFNYTFITGLILIVIFFLSPQIINVRNNLAIKSLEVKNDSKVNLVAGVTDDTKNRIKAGDLVNFVAEQVGGKGGGRPDMAQAGGDNPKKLESALAKVPDWVRTKLEG